MSEIAIKNIEELPDAVGAFIAGNKPGRVYAFYGPMGVGKTTFISEMCRQLGSEDDANSPTFSIVNEYLTDSWGTVYHLDCYRLDSEEEAFDAGVEDIFDSGQTCFVEWPERIEGLLPEDAVVVELRLGENNERILKWSNYGSKR